MDETHVEVFLNKFLKSFLFRYLKRVYRVNWRLSTLFQIDLEIIKIRSENFSFGFTKYVSKFVIFRRNI